MVHFTARFQTYSRALPVSTVQWRAERPQTSTKTPRHPSDHHYHILTSSTRQHRS